MISAHQAYDKVVFTADSKKLGRCKNIIMNVNTKHADLFVIPENFLSSAHASRIFRNQKGAIIGTAGNIGGEQGTQKALTLVPEVSKVIGLESLDFVSNVPAGFLGGLLGSWIQRTIKSIEESYYLIPISNIKSVNKEDIQLTIDYALSQQWFLNVKVTTDHQPFFPFDRKLLSRLQIMGLNSIKNPILEEKESSSTRGIKDLEIDSFNDVASIIIRNLESLSGH